MFKSVRVDIGTVKVGTEQRVYFPYEDIKEIIELSSTCGCGTPKEDKPNSRIESRYVPAPIPPHLVRRLEFSYKKTMWINVTYKDKEDKIKTEQLEINATVKA